MSWLEGAATIRDRTGLHARPAVKLTKLAKGFAAAVEIRGDGQADWVNAKSPNKVMKLKAAYGTALQVRAEGTDAGAALAAILALIDDNFGEPVAG